MNLRIKSIFLLSAIFLINLRAHAAERPPSLQAQINRLPPADAEFVAKAPYAGEYTLSQIVTYSNREGRLLADFHLPENLQKQLQGQAPVLLTLQASPHIYTLHRRQAGTLDTNLSLLTLNCFAPDDPGPFNHYTLSSDGNSIMVSAVQMFGHPLGQQSLLMNQGEKIIHLAWRLQSEKWQAKKLDVLDMHQLPTKAPNLLEKYLIPILRRLGPASSAADIYQAFDQIPADEKVLRQIEPIIARLDSQDAAQRQSALIALQSLGRPATLAALRLDPAALSPEQRNRLAEFYATQGWFHPADLQALKSDEDFLRSATTDEDPAVRSAATNILTGLQATRLIRPSP